MSNHDICNAQSYEGSTRTVPNDETSAAVQQVNSPKEMSSAEPCLFECGITVIAAGLRQHIKDKHSMSKNYMTVNLSEQSKQSIYFGEFPVEQSSPKHKSESNEFKQIPSLLQNDSVTCPFECSSNVYLTGLKKHIIDNHSSYRETEIHNDSLKRSDSIPCEKVSKSHCIHPLRNEELNASALQKLSCQKNWINLHILQVYYRLIVWLLAPSSVVLKWT